MEALTEAAALIMVAGTALELTKQFILASEQEQFFEALAQGQPDRERVLEIAQIDAKASGGKTSDAILKAQQAALEAAQSYYATPEAWEGMKAKILDVITKPAFAQLEVGFDMMRKIELAIAKHLNIYPLADETETKH